MCKSTGEPSCIPNSAVRPARWTASLLASEAATISASQEDKATVACFLDAHEMAGAGMKARTWVERTVIDNERGTNKW